MRLLILGGTLFLGRHVAAAALAAGDDVTLFTRGRTNPGLFPDARRLTGDRAGDLRALEGTEEWDLVVDTSGFVPRDVLAGARILAGRAGRYVFVSSGSAIADWPEKAWLDERAPAYECPPDVDARGRRPGGASAAGPAGPGLAGPAPDDYGVLKAGCERAVLGVFGDAAQIVRAGLLVGPYETVGRLPAWIERAERGGPLLVPGPPDRALQLLDARDLAAWMLEPGRTGTFVAAGPPETMAALPAALGAADPVWASDAELTAAGIEEWTELPFWTTEAESPGAMRLDARVAAIPTRPLAETVRDTRRWLLHEGGRAEVAAASPPRGGASVLDAAREREIAAGVRRAAGSA